MTFIGNSRLSRSTRDILLWKPRFRRQRRCSAGCRFGLSLTSASLGLLKALCVLSFSSLVVAFFLPLSPSLSPSLSPFKSRETYDSMASFPLSTSYRSSWLLTKPLLHRDCQNIPHTLKPFFNNTQTHAAPSLDHALYRGPHIDMVEAVSNSVPSVMLEDTFIPSLQGVRG